MKKSDKTAKPTHRRADPNVMGLRADVVEQNITETLETNYMPYAMSVIVSRAIPEIDGFKPSHRKLLYTMYKMGLLTGARTKSANIVGQTMRLNPHGDAAIYDTMVRLSKGYGALLHPFVDSKGNFGKVYSRDMAWAASRYTEAKLAPVCVELFRDIDSDTVDFIDNYDNTMKEPALLPTTFPNILVSANQGIAVGMASQLCGFNLGEVCDTTIAFLKNPEVRISETLLAPDFPTGGEILYDARVIEDIYNTGRGGVKVRARWRYDKKENLIEIYEIPYTTTSEAIMDKVAELIKAGKVKEISDMRDETDLSGLKLTIDLKRGADPDKLMQKLFKSTTLQDTASCNFNVLIGGMPRVMGVRELLDTSLTLHVETDREKREYLLDNLITREVTYIEDTDTADGICNDVLQISPTWKYNLDGSLIEYRLSAAAGSLPLDGVAGAAQGDSLTVDYRNDGVPNHAGKTDAAYPGGSVNLTLTGTRGYEAQKVWLDDGSAEAAAQRPEGTLQLWRYREGQEPGTATPVFSGGRMVEAALPGDGGAILFEENGKAIELPKYDADGFRYI